MDEKFSKLRFSEFAKAAAAGAIVGAAALVPVAAEAATGSVEIHAGNAIWFVNTNITFSTTSSAFGLSSATLLTAVSSREDAFDGALSWHVNASPPGSLSDGGYRSPGGTASVTANSVTGTVQVLAGLNVQGQLYFTTDKAVVRSVLTLQNPTGAPITATVDNDNNLGSDSATRITATSNGTAIFDSTANWVISCQASLAPPACDGPGTGDDPVLTYAIQGPGSTVRGTTLGGFVNGNDNPNERFTVTVPAGGTSALMYFVQLSDTPDHALIDAAVFNSPDALETAGYLANLPVQKSQILNWGIAAGVPTLSEWAFGGFAAMLGLIGLGSLGLFTRRRSAQS